MYKKIILENTINQQKIEIPLTKGVNLIVGPRGGGKSSLLELLAGASLNIKSKKVKSVFEGTLNNPFQFKKIIQDSDEEINSSFLNITSNQIANDKYDNNLNIIAQNDRTKTNLVSTEMIEKYKNKEAMKIASSEKYISLFNKFDNLKTTFSQISYAYTDKRIYWQHAFNIDNLYSKDNIIINLNYDKNYAKESIIQTVKKFENFKDELDVSSVSLRKFCLFLERYNPFLKNFKQLCDQEIKNTYITIEKIKNKINLEIKKIKKFENLSNIFSKQYSLIIDELKKSTEENNKVKAFQVQSLAHMKNMALLFKKMKFNFNNIFQKNWDINNEYESTKDLLTYKLQGNISFKKDEKIDLLESLLYKSNTATEPIKWLDQFLVKGSKNIKNDTFQKALSKIIKNKIDVYANNKIYEHMSPGEKSVFGIKYKLIKSKDKILFLDQPEDNLDNHTIAKEMLQLINAHPAQQVILVTHNANIGILTNPNNVIIAKLDNKENPYMVGKIPDLNDDPKAFYLEGGSNYLIRRYEKLIKMTGDNS